MTSNSPEPSRQDIIDKVDSILKEDAKPVVPTPEPSMEEILASIRRLIDEDREINQAKIQETTKAVTKVMETTRELDQKQVDMIVETPTGPEPSMEEILDAIRRIIYDIPKDQPVPEHLKKQYLSPEGKEPSMEEIMASIRRIITSDDTEETKSVVPPKAPEPFKEPSMEEIMASIGRIIDSDDTEEAKPVEPPKAPEPPKERSMDEILASIRDIIAADSHPEPNPMITLLVTINGTLNGIRDLLDKRLPEPPVKPTEEIDSQVILAAIHQIVTDAEIPEIAARFGLTPQQVVFFKTEMEKNQRKAAIPVEKPIVQDKMNLTAEERQAAEWAALAEDEFDNDMKRKGGGVRVLNEREIDSLMGFDREDEPSLTQPAAKSGSIPEGIRFPNCRQCRLFQEHLTQPRCGHGEAPPWTPEEISIARQHPLYGDFRPASCPFKGA